jgi:hypothetical protein
MRNGQTSNIFQAKLVLLATPTAILKRTDQLTASGIDIFTTRTTRDRNNALTRGMIAKPVNVFLR